MGITGTRSGWDLESQAGACFVLPVCTENIHRNICIYSMENSTVFFSVSPSLFLLFSLHLFLIHSFVLFFSSLVCWHKLTLPLFSHVHCVGMALNGLISFTALIFAMQQSLSRVLRGGHS